MVVRLIKPWVDLTEQNVKTIAAHLGVYQLGTESGEILFIGVANARSRFGLKGELIFALERRLQCAAKFRVEVTMSYHSRYLELLGAFFYDNGRLPIGNLESDISRISKISPGGNPESSKSR